MATKPKSIPIIDEAEKAKEKFLKALDITLLNPPDVEVGTSPHEVIFTENKLRLLHYYPQTEESCSTPLILVFALVNRPYILDLMPGRSVVEVLLKKGIPVYLIDWARPETKTRTSISITT